MIAKIFDFISNIGNILGILPVIFSIIIYIFRKRKVKYKLQKIYILTSVGLGIGLLFLIYFFPKLILPKTKQYIDWVSSGQGTKKGLFQDFDDISEDLIDKLWADPTTYFHGNNKPATISSQLIQVDSSNDKYVIRITFNSQGNGSNITIRCKGSTPVNAKDASYLVFESRFIPGDTSAKYLGLKIRIFDEDGEVWAISHRKGATGEDYETRDIKIIASPVFEVYKIDLNFFLNETSETKPWKFLHDGNAFGGDNKASFAAISRITYDFLPRGITGELILDNIRFE